MQYFLDKLHRKQSDATINNNNSVLKNTFFKRKYILILLHN